MEAKHTPTPWYVVDNERYLEIVVPWSDFPDRVDRYCPGIANLMYGGNQEINGWANAEFIVRAVNSHDALVKALQCIVNDLAENDEEGLIEHTEPMIQARAALALAGEKP